MNKSFVIMLKTFNILDSYKEGFTDSFSMDFAKVKLECLDHNSDCESYQFLQATTLNQQYVTYGSI